MIGKLRSRPLLLAILLLLLIVPTAAAATIVADDEDYVLPAGETVEGNLYVMGQTVTIKGTVTGDLVAMAETVEVAPGGVVKQDILAAGQTVRVSGTVEDDFRAAGFTVEVDDNAAVGGDFMAVGFNVSAGEGSLIRGDVLAAGYQGFADGEVGGDVRFAGVGLELNGSVAGSVEAEVDEASDTGFSMSFMPLPAKPPRDVKPGLQVGDDAEIAGDLDITSPAEPEGLDEIAGGAYTFSEPEVDKEADAEDEEEEEEPNEAVDWLIAVVKKYVSLLIFGLILMWIAPRTVSTAATVLSERKLPSLGWGLVTVAVAVVLAIAIPIVTIMVAVFLGVIQLEPLIKPLLAAAGLLWSFVTFGVYLLSWAARIVVAVWIGRAILGRAAPNVVENRVVLLLLGLLIYVLLANIPYVGILFKLVFILLGIGAMEAHSWLSMLSRHHAEPAPAPPAEA